MLDFAGKPAVRPTIGARVIDFGVGVDSPEVTFVIKDMWEQQQSILLAGDDGQATIWLPSQSEHYMIIPA